MRNRLVGGVARPPMTNYYRGETKASSPFEKKRPKKAMSAKFIKAIDWLIVVVAIFCLIYSLIVKPDPKVIASSTSYNSITNYQAAASAAMKDFKDHNKITFDETSLATSLKKQFPEIDNVDIELPMLGEKPVIRLTIAEPKFALSSKGVRYVVADNGIVVAEAMNFADDDDLPVVTDESGFDVQIGKAVLSSDEVNFINQVVLQCEKAAVPISSLALPPKGQELDLKTKDKKYYVKFNLVGDPMVEIGQFLAARHQFTRNHQNPSQYLDVRIAGRIFYK